MAVHPADAALHHVLFGDAETAALFSDAEELQALLAVEAALAEVQAEMGMIPPAAASAIARACRDFEPDMAALAMATARNGVAIPGLVAALRARLPDPSLAGFVHWGVTSQDVVDTALVLRLKPLLALWRARMQHLLECLADLADAHADLPMAARTYGQVAVPTRFGAVVAGWGRPLLRQLDRLDAVEHDLLVLSLGGAAGTLSAMGGDGPAVRARLAARLGLRDPGAPWHAERDRVAAFGGWMAGLAGSLGKLGEDVLALTQSGLAELSLAGAGGSSTMPQKENPVGPSVLVALARQALGLSATLSGAMLHRQQRDGAAWFVEWLTLPALCLATGAALLRAREVVEAMVPRPDRMAALLEIDGGTIHAEALTFALARTMPRSQAEAAVRALCGDLMHRQSLALGRAPETAGIVPPASAPPGLLDLARRDHPDLDLSAVGDAGDAIDQARAFVRRVRG